MTHPTWLDLVDLALGPAQAHEDLTIFPLIAWTTVELPYRLLEDALEDGSLEVDEVDGDGSRPELLATNRGESEVLVLAGEQLPDATRNLRTNRSLLLPANAATHIPAPCFERGRGRPRSPDSGAAEPRSRAREPVPVTGVRSPAKDTLPELGRAQYAVWYEVAAYAREAGIRSGTGGLDEVDQTVASKLEDWVPRFPSLERQVGLLAFARERPIGLDLIGGCGLYGRLHARLVRGYALDALLGRRPGQRRAGSRPSRGQGAPTDGGALRFLAEVQKAERTEAPTAGRGAYRILSGAVVGGELVDGRRLAHRSALEADRASA